LPKTARVPAVVLSIAILTIAGGLLVREHAAPAATPLGRGFDLAPLLGGSRSPEGRLIENAFRKVGADYYKPVDPQVILDGERAGLQGYLRRAGVANPGLPTVRASANESRDVALADAQLATARRISGGKATSEDLAHAALRGMLSSLGDPYTVYLSKHEIDSLEESLKGGDFGGIGVYIVQDAKTSEVLIDPIEGTPAFKAGVKPGDVIASVDGTSIRGLKLDDVERMIRGKIGSVVHLRVHRPRATALRTVAVVRDQIHVPSVHAKMQDGFEYVRLADFGQTSFDEVRQALRDGKARHAAGYILDLRDNGGGLLDAAVQISSLFIDHGPIVSTIDRAGAKTTRSAIAGQRIGAAPLAVLVNKYTASASEITAGAVQDDKAGVLVGTKTFGKGVVQSIYDMTDGGALKITTARYVTPAGRDIQHKGIVPDLVVDQPVELPIVDTAHDKQLAAAEAYLRRAARK